MANRQSFLAVLSFFLTVCALNCNVVSAVPTRVSTSESIFQEQTVQQLSSQKEDNFGESMRSWRSTMIRDRESLPVSDT